MEGLPEVHFFDIEITSVFRFHHQKDGFQGRVGDDVLETLMDPSFTKCAGMVERLQGFCKHWSLFIFRAIK